MNTDRNIFVVGDSKEYANWMRGTLVLKIEDADLVLFTGGDDVCPKLYNEPIGMHTGYSTVRDAKEVDVFNQALSLGKHMIGICRGAQFLCVMSGGRLVQHQQNLYSQHSLITREGTLIDITSTHHQAQYPYEMHEKDYELLAWTLGISKFHWDGTNKEISPVPFKEAEIVYYPQTFCLGIQGHPEYMWHNYGLNKSTFIYLHRLLDNFLLNKI